VTSVDRQVWLLLRLALALAAYRGRVTAEADDIASAARLLTSVTDHPAQPPAGFDASTMVG
jgi:hypothetical protein